jgi:glycerol kinase
MGMHYVLSLDQGTTSSRAILFDVRGRVCGVAQQEFAQHFPQPGWVEHDATEIWDTQLAVARQVLRAHGVAAGDLVAVGVANQRETTVLWDRATGEPVAPAIVWQDRRTAQACARLKDMGHQAQVAAWTGLELDAYFSSTKLAWLLDHVPGARERAERGELAFGTIDSWLVFKLTGGLHATDASNASRTQLFNIHTQQWDDRLLGLFGIPHAVLPQVVASSGVLGHCRSEWLGAAVPLAGLAGDQQAAMFGQACHRPGMAKNTYGTGCFMLLNTGGQAVASRHRLLTTVGWSLGSAKAPTYCLEGSVFMGGATVQWLRDGLQMIRSAEEVEALAAGVPDSGDVFLVPAFAGLGAPHWDGHARGTLLGLTRGTTRAHIARAALEAIALQSAEVLAAMQADAGLPLDELRVDGGASRNDLLMQMQADLCGVPVVRPAVTETTALGAAFLAGLAVGFWQDEADVAAHWQMARVFEPLASADWREARLHRWGKAVARSLAWAEGG